MEDKQITEQLVEVIAGLVRAIDDLTEQIKGLAAGPERDPRRPAAI